MAVTVTNSFNNTDSWDANKVNTNFSDVLSWANGGITTANISGSAGIVNSQLANDDFVFTVNLQSSGATWSASTPQSAHCLPYIGSDTWTVIGYTYYCTDSGNNDGQFTLGYYTRTGVGAIVLETTILGATTITSYDGTTTNVIALGRGTLNIDVTTTAGKTAVFAVLKSAAGTGVMSNAADFLSVTLLLKRKAGLGSF